MLMFIKSWLVGTNWQYPNFPARIFLLCRKIIEIFTSSFRTLLYPLKSLVLVILLNLIIEFNSFSMSSVLIYIFNDSSQSSISLMENTTLGNRLNTYTNNNRYNNLEQHTVIENRKKLDNFYSTIKFNLK